MSTTQASTAGDDDRKRAEVYFERGRVVAQTENYQYAIEMYIQGLEYAPGSLDAVLALREISLLRKARGAKDIGMLQKLKMPKAANAKQKMLNGLMLLAYSPMDVERMRTVSRSAFECGCDEIGQWMANILKQAERG